MTLRSQWDSLRPLIPDGAAMHVALAAEGVFAEYDARIEVLERALEELRGTYATQFCMDRDLDMVISSSTDAGEGDRIRATDTGREFVLRDGGWFEERPWRPATTAGMDDDPVALTPVDGIVNGYRDKGDDHEVHDQRGVHPAGDETRW